MAVIKSVSVGFKSTVQTTEYGNIQPSYHITADLQPGDDVDEIVAGLTALCKGYARRAIIKKAAEDGNVAEKVYAGLPEALRDHLRVITVDDVLSSSRQ
jgi:hypothetical protein